MYTALAIISGFAILIFRVIISHRPFRAPGMRPHAMTSTFLGWFLWILLTILERFYAPLSRIDGWDIFCGILILLCASWCNYWIGNLAGGFRVQMQINLVNQPRPVSLEEWMLAFGGLGMKAFLRDRLTSILIPWRIVTMEDDKVRLLPGWGLFFGRLMKILGFILYDDRGHQSGD
jgi:hypothetical protein